MHIKAYISKMSRGMGGEGEGRGRGGRNGPNNVCTNE
jgi:hypothetical protein